MLASCETWATGYFGYFLLSRGRLPVPQILNTIPAGVRCWAVARLRPSWPATRGGMSQKAGPFEEVLTLQPRLLVPGTDPLDQR